VAVLLAVAVALAGAFRPLAAAVTPAQESPDTVR
jgi:hypothetical protein